MNYIKKLFNRWAKPETVNEKPTTKPNKAILNMNALQDELKAIDAGFNRSIKEKEREYNSASNEYEEAYEAYTALFKRQRIGLESKGKVTAEQVKLKPLEGIVRDLGSELDTIKRYKREEINSLLLSMNHIQDDYIKAKSDEMNLQASKLKMLQLEYQQKFTAYATGCNEVYNTEQVMKQYLQQYSYTGDIKMGELFTALVKKEMPIPFE